MNETAAEFVSIDQIHEWADNPRKNEHAVAAVASSIKRFGFGSPIVARKENGEIIAGHTRYKAARSLGLREVPVRFLDIDPVDAHLLALADNKTGEAAEWDDDALADVLKSLDAYGASLDDLGFDSQQLEQLLMQEVSEPSPSEPMEEIPCPIDAPALTEPGEVVALEGGSLHCGDCIEVMQKMEPDSLPAIVCDPPYGIGFMGSDWDCSVPSKEFAEVALRVLKPGGHLIAFAACRTVHRLTVALEDAGFEVRDMFAWMQWQGFPKSQDLSKAIDQHLGAEREVVGERSTGIGTGKGSTAFIGDGNRDLTAPASPQAKQWQGWGSALKPSYEPCIIVRKPLIGTMAENVLKFGCGGINIDGCRALPGDPSWPGPNEKPSWEVGTIRSNPGFFASTSDGMINTPPSPLGRWPANIYHCPKPSVAEREKGCDELSPDKWKSEGRIVPVDFPSERGTTTRGNSHPTVKPIQLMRHLVKLVTPDGGVVLDPFTGSGSTLLAAQLEGFQFIGIEQEPKFCDITRARLKSLKK